MYIASTFPKFLLYHRSNKNPEICRKLEFIFDFKTIINFIFFNTFLMIFIIYMFLYFNIKRILSCSKLFGTFLFDILKLEWQIQENCESFNTILNNSIHSNDLMILLKELGCFSIFIVWLKLFSYTTHWHKFNLIVNSIFHVLKDFPLLISIFFLFLISFSRFFQIFEGNYSENYSSIILAFLKLLESLTYIPNLEYFYDIDNYSSFIMLIPYILIMKFIIINMILSISYNAYQILKESSQKTDSNRTNIKIIEFFQIIINILKIWKKKEIKKNSHQKSFEIFSQITEKSDPCKVL